MEGFNYYENSGYKNDRKKTLSLILDLKEDDNNTENELYLSKSKDFNVELFEPLIIDKHSTIYLDSFITYNCNLSENIDNSAFSLKINEFNINSVCASNDVQSDKISGGILIPNENGSLDNYFSSVNHKAKKFNYVCDINPCTLSRISGKITNIKGGPAFCGHQSNHSKIFGIYNITQWSDNITRDNTSMKAIINSIKFSYSNGSPDLLITMTSQDKPTIISNSPKDSSVILISLTKTDYDSITTDTFNNNIEYLNNITLSTQTDGEGADTLVELTGNLYITEQSSSGFRLISEFVIVSE